MAAQLTQPPHRRLSVTLGQPRFGEHRQRTDLHRLQDLVRHRQRQRRLGRGLGTVEVLLAQQTVATQRLSHARQQRVRRGGDILFGFVEQFECVVLLS